MDRRKSGAILPNGKINLKLIQREVANDIENDARYSAQDAMKKRAVHMSKDYDEFQNFVSVSQLKPIKSTEMGQLFTHRKSFDSNQKSSGIRNVIFNRMGQSGGLQSSTRRSSSARDCLLVAEMNHDSGSGSGGGGGSGSYKHSCRADASIANAKTDRPKNSLELEREWKKCHADKSPLQALRYLLMAQGDELHTILCNNNDFEQQDESLMSPPCVQNVPLNFRQTPEYIATLYKVEMDSTMMEQIIKAISLFLTCSSSNHPMMTTTRLNFMYRTMYSITTCGRFSLHINFMNDQHQNNVRCILDRLQLEYKNERYGIRTDSEVLVYNGKDIEILYELYHVAPVDACK